MKETIFYNIGVSIGGDSDTLAAITGSIAEVYYGIPDKIKFEGLSYLDNHLNVIVNEFLAKYPPKDSIE